MRYTIYSIQFTFCLFRYCNGTNSLDRNKVQGKIVLCDGEIYFDAVIVAGVVCVIITSNVAADDPP